MDTNEENIIIGLIARHLSGETNPEEEQQLNVWLDSGRENRRQFEDFRTVWQKMGRVSSVAGLDIEAEWKSLESQIDESRMDESQMDKSRVDETGRVINIIEESSKSKKEISAASHRSSLYIFSRAAIAAVVVFALALGGIYTARNVGYRTLATSELSGEVILSDGSRVTLNSHSSLRYPKKFNTQQRDVSLKGEGFFEVNGDPEWPFMIATAELDIKVLGTSFNVNAYDSNDEIEVVVKTGQVAVTRKGDVPKTIILKPGSKAVYHKSEENLKLSTKIDENYLAWKTRSFVFEDESLADVVAALNKVYASNIIIPSDSLKEAKITSSFNDQSLDAILNVLSATLDIELVESGGQILLKESN